MQISNETFGINPPIVDKFPEFSPAQATQMFELAKRLFGVAMFDTAWAATLIMLIMNSFDTAFNQVCNYSFVFLNAPYLILA